MKKPAKKILLISLTIIVTIFMISSGYAAETSKMLKGWFGVKIKYNNQQLVSNAEPFIVDGTTYVPLRMLMTSFGKDITWDSATSTVNIFDKPSTTEIELRNQIIVKDATIAKLQADLDKARANQDDDDSADLDDLEESLNDDYEDFNNKSFEITLDGDEDEIEVRIDVSSSHWSALSSSNRTTLLEGICEDIRDEYDDAEISGYVKNSSSSSKLMYFYFNPGEKVSMNADEDIINFEKELHDDYNDYFDSEDIPLYITLTGSTSAPVFYINVDYHAYDDEWDDLDEDDIEELMSDIFDAIQDEFDCDDDDIDGYVYDTYDEDEIATYYKSSSGTVNFSSDKH